jgi:preprotein translocase subunit SecG
MFHLKQKIMWIALLITGIILAILKKRKSKSEQLKNTQKL